MSGLNNRAWIWRCGSGYQGSVGRFHSGSISRNWRLGQDLPSSSKITNSETNYGWEIRLKYRLISRPDKSPDVKVWSESWQIDKKQGTGSSYLRLHAVHDGDVHTFVWIEIRQWANSFEASSEGCKLAPAQNKIGRLFFDLRGFTRLAVWEFQ